MANIDPTEVQQFSARARDWWAPNGAFRTLHDINEARLGYLCRFIDPSISTVLDAGCGGGVLAEALARRGAKVTGLDASEENIAVAREHAAHSGLEIDYQVADVDSFSRTRPARFDVVTCLELLEHVPDPAALVQSCATLVRPGGQVFFSTIHRRPKAYFAAIVVAEYLLSLIPRGTHRYDRFVRPSELASWCRAARLQVQDISGLRYLPWLRRACLCADTDINYLLVAFRGTHSDTAAPTVPGVPA